MDGAEEVVEESSSSKLFECFAAFASEADETDVLTLPQVDAVEVDFDINEPEAKRRRGPKPKLVREALTALRMGTPSSSSHEVPVALETEEAASQKVDKRAEERLARQMGFSKVSKCDLLPLQSVSGFTVASPGVAHVMDWMEKVSSSDRDEDVHCFLERATQHDRLASWATLADEANIRGRVLQK